MTNSLSFIFYYMSTIFEKYFGIAPLTASGLSGAAATVEALAFWTILLFIERFGRRAWLISGAVFQTLFLAVVRGVAPFPGSRTGDCRRGDDIWLLHCSWGDLGSHTGITHSPGLMPMIRGKILVLIYLDSHSTPQKSCHFGIVNLDMLSPAQAIGLVNSSPSLQDQLLTPTAVDTAGRPGSGS